MAQWPMPPDGLPRPKFIETDSQVLTAEAIKVFEEYTGKTLHPAQPERLTVNALAYLLSLHALKVQNAQEQGLADFAMAPMLDYIGRNILTPRLDPQPARCTVRASTPAPRVAPVLVRAGTRLAPSDGTPIFTLEKDLWLPAGTATVDGIVAAAVAGPIGNGYAAGQLTPIEALADDVILTNITPSAGGIDLETDEPYRLRVLAAPESFSTAGPFGAYQFHARSVSQAIVDVDVRSPVPSDIVVTVLTEEGMPPPELLAAVNDRLNDRLIRPMCDVVAIEPPTRVAWTLKAGLILSRDADAELTKAMAELAIAAFIDARRRKLGRDLVGRQFQKVLQVTGVHDVVLESPADRVVLRFEWADCEGIEVTIAGRADD